MHERRDKLRLQALHCALSLDSRHHCHLGQALHPARDSVGRQALWRGPVALEPMGAARAVVCGEPAGSAVERVCGGEGERGVNLA